jgi:Uma2 family endonuclease
MMATAALSKPFSLQDTDKLYTLEEYLVLEERAEYKNEFHNGQIIPMPGGTYHHNLISSNIIRSLGNVVITLSQKYRVLNGDMKIRVEEYNQVLYGDALVICEKPEFYNGRKDVIINPLVIVEVLSTSTEAYDRGEKFDKYATLDSFKEYLLVRQDKLEIISYFREEYDLWRRTVVRGLDASLLLKSIQANLDLKDVYDGVEL